VATDLADFIQQTPLCDSHEHMNKEDDYLNNGPDVLQCLFQNYVYADLVVAGAEEKAVDSLIYDKDSEVTARFRPVQKAWESVVHTGYGEAVRYIARSLFDLDELTPESLEAAQEKARSLIRPGQRLRILKELANLDHIQTDDGCRPCLPDASGPDFFFYDISWASFCRGVIDVPGLADETGIEVKDLSSLRRAMETVFEKYAACAIAIKSQHAYYRTIEWRERMDDEAARSLAVCLGSGENAPVEHRLCLGDWCWSRGVELGIRHDLPFKIHTGYYAGQGRMPVDFIKGGNLCSLLMRYPEARFVLMHIAYPYNDELIALAKHFRNVYSDLCWAWSIDPYSSANFVRRFIRAVPANKLFVFGGDTMWPGAAMAYAYQARKWLTYALEREVEEGLLAESEAIDLADRYMRGNQYDCFRVEAKKQSMLEAVRSVA
jgi:hypothetical protein